MSVGFTLLHRATDVPPDDRFPPMAPLGDIPPEELRAHLHRLADWIADYRRDIDGRRITPRLEPGDVRASTPAAMPAHPTPTGEILDDLDAVVMPGILHWGHPRFLGYFGSTSNGPALLGEIASAALNVSAMTWKTSPAATELETLVLEWIRDLIALPREFTGVVYDTASVGVVHALAAAREAAVPDMRRKGLLARDAQRILRVYASDQAHSSIAKAMSLLGLGEDNLVRIPCDDAFRMDVNALSAAIRHDLAGGMQPLAVVATIGTTSTASSDPLVRVASVCTEHDLWLHVDAAYGGAIAALPEHRGVLLGVERADSFVVNPHKWLFVPLDFSCLYVRRPELLRRTFALTPEYLEGDAGPDELPPGRIDYMDYGIQLGRRFRALKAWMVLRAMGTSGIEARLREHVRLGALLASWVGESSEFELVTHDMAIVCFRAVAAGMAADDADRFNQQVVERVNDSGRAYLTYTRLRGRVCIRAGFGNVSTTEAHLREVWDALIDSVRA